MAAQEGEYINHCRSEASVGEGRERTGVKRERGAAEEEMRF